MQLKAHAPGSLMLLGEYAVLHNKPALVCAVDKRITVTLTPRTDTQITIRSPLLGDYTTSIDQIQIEKPFQFVLAVLELYKSKFKYGCDLQIESEFSDKIGFGSSAAVTVATCAVLAKWFKLHFAKADLVRQARQAVRNVQGMGSGADVAASVYGGMVAYTAQPVKIEKFSVSYPITVLYAGFKTPTVTAIQTVQTNFAGRPALFRHICASIGQCAVEGIQCVRNEDWAGLGSVMNTQQGMLDALGVNLPVLHAMVMLLRQQSSVLGAKISGSGFGDCVIGLGAVPAVVGNQQDKAYIPVAVSLQGVQCEKI